MREHDMYDKNSKNPLRRVGSIAKFWLNFSFYVFYVFWIKNDHYMFFQKWIVKLKIKLMNHFLFKGRMSHKSCYLWDRS